MAVCLPFFCLPPGCLAADGARHHNVDSDASVVIIDGRVIKSGTAQKVVTSRRSLASFHGVEVNGFPGDIVIVPGDVPELSLTAEPRVIARIETVVKQGILTIFSRESFSTSAALAIRIVSPGSLDSIVYTGPGELTAEGLHGSRLRIRLSGAGSMRLGGKVHDLEVVLEGSGDADLRSLNSVTCRVVAKGASEVQVKASRSLEATASGSSSVLYFGHPEQLAVTVHDAGEVTAGD